MKGLSAVCVAPPLTALLSPGTRLAGCCSPASHIRRPSRCVQLFYGAGIQSSCMSPIHVFHLSSVFFLLRRAVCWNVCRGVAVAEQEEDPEPQEGREFLKLCLICVVFSAFLFTPLRSVGSAPSLLSSCRLVSALLWSWAFSPPLF